MGICCRAGEVGNSVVDASGDGICCMFLELGPRLKGLRLVLERFSGDGVRSSAFVSFRRLMTVPKRLRPPIAPLRCSFTAS